MVVILSLMWISLSLMNADFKIDFGSEKMGRDWMVINDGVMGGQSRGDAYLSDNAIQFRGVISLDNNGGFASIRSRFGVYNLSGFSTLTIRYKASGQAFALTLEQDRRWYVPYYKYELPVSDDWTTKTINLSDFKETRIGRLSGETLSDSRKSTIIRLGMIVFNKIEGPFDIEVDYLQFR